MCGSIQPLPIPIIKRLIIQSSFLGTTLSIVMFYVKVSAKLGPLKLRKFIEFYTDFYPKAKTNRRLMASIQMAEERLSQNDQEV